MNRAASFCKQTLFSLLKLKCSCVTVIVFCYIYMYIFMYLGPADMTEQLVSVQNSVMVPYNMLIWLKKSTAEING